MNFEINLMLRGICYCKKEVICNIYQGFCLQGVCFDGLVCVFVGKVVQNDQEVLSDGFVDFVDVFQVLCIQVVLLMVLVLILGLLK